MVGIKWESRLAVNCDMTLFLFRKIQVTISITLTVARYRIRVPCRIVWGTSIQSTDVLVCAELSKVITLGTPYNPFSPHCS